jgi:hypothetical protein
MKRRPLSQATLDQAVRDVEACRFTSNALDSAAGWHPDVLLALFNKGASNSAASELFKKNLKSHRLGGGTWTPPTTEPTSVQEMLGSMTPWEHRQAMLAMDTFAETSAREEADSDADEARDDAADDEGDGC